VNFFPKISPPLWGKSTFPFFEFPYFSFSLFTLFEFFCKSSRQFYGLLFRRRFAKIIKKREKKEKNDVSREMFLNMK
jgi:hypothetical protein